MKVESEVGRDREEAPRDRQWSEARILFIHQLTEKNSK